MPTTSRAAGVGDTSATVREPTRWRTEHGPFLVALALGVVIRVVVQLAFDPAMVHSDSPTYLSFIDTLQPHPDRPDGYGLLVLYPLSWITDKVLAVALLQHLMGLVIAALVYGLLRRWGVGRWSATLATLPVLFDTLQLIVEHTVLSDTLFELLLILAIVVLGWRRRPSLAVALVTGLLLGVSVTVRLVGEPLVLAGVAFCLLVGDGWRARLASAVALAAGFVLPIGAYAAWYHHEHGVYALAESIGKSTYVRTTTFVDCPKLSVADYQRVLCPAEPLGQRLDPTYYAFHDLRTLPRLHPPPGTTPDESMREFALAAISQQPVDYAWIVARDFLLNFDVLRVDRFEYSTAHKWVFFSYLHPQPTAWTGPAYAAHGGEQLSARQPFADMLAGYQWVGYLPGPLLFGCLVLGLLGGLGIGRARHSGMRSMGLLLTCTGAGLLLVPDLTADFSWRYQLPALALLPAGAALGFSALRGHQLDPDEVDTDPAAPAQIGSGTVATARTD